MSVIDDVARWVSGLEYDDVPERVRELARHQVASVTGAVFAGANCGGGEALTRAVDALGETGPCAAFPGGEGRTLFSALLQNCSLSMALDYDDYLFLGHTGHSAVNVPLALAGLRDVDSKTVMTAQVAANEIEGRLGGSVVLGPHNGQMWAHIHLLGAAAAASKVLGLDEERTANALGIAMAEPVYALFPGFMGPHSKLLTAAVPSVTGATSALLAEQGMTGSRGIIEDGEGFWRHFAFIPLPFMMTGLGASWVTDTIAFKPYPGCAYIDTSVDAMLELMRGFATERGRAMEPGEVREIEVHASLLTAAMDAMSHSYLDPSRLSPTNINFSLSVSLAILLVAGELTGAQLTEAFLDSNREAILAVAAKVRLVHDAAMSVAFARSLDEAVDLAAMLSQISPGTFLKVRTALREHLGRVGTLGAAEALRAWKSLGREDRAFLKRLVSLRTLFGAGAPYDLGRACFEDASMPFAARVRVVLDDGRSMECERGVPRGGPGDPGRLEVPPEKFLRECAPRLSEEGAREALETILAFEEHTPREICASIAPGR